MARIIKCKNKLWARTAKLEDRMAAHMLQCKEIRRLVDASANINIDKTLVGVFVCEDCRDERAYYRVVKDKPFTLEWIPYGDLYRLTVAEEKALTPERIRQEVLWARMTRVC